jgi:hypothetical protein
VFDDGTGESRVVMPKQIAPNDEPIHPSFFRSKSELEFKLAEAEYFLEQMRVVQGKARRGQEQMRPQKMNDQRVIFTYYFSAFVGAGYNVRELFRRATNGDENKKTWLKNVTDSPLCHFFGKLREMNTHRRVVSAGMSFRSKWVAGRTQIDMAVVFGQKSSNPYMSPLFFSIDGNALDKAMAKVYADLQSAEGDPTLSVTATAARYLEELRKIFVDGVAQGTFA